MDRLELSRRPSERGAALLIAMIIVALIATLATSMVWQQWRAVQVEAAERSRAQSTWILNGALDWARLILKEDRHTQTDDLGETWAVPLAEARLSTFLAADKDNTDDGPEAFLSGSIVDAQSRYNLLNLVGKTGPALVVELETLQRLFESIGVAPDLASRIASSLQSAAPPSSPASGASEPVAAPSSSMLMPQSVRQLSWFGIDDATVERMALYVAILPSDANKVNVNTASREVIAAVLHIDMSSAQRLIQARQSKPFQSLADVTAITQLGQSPAGYSFTTSYFEVHGRLRLTDRVLEESSLVQRDSALNVKTIWRRRENTREPGS
jgi:general secretion pathway protein K